MQIGQHKIRDDGRADCLVCGVTCEVGLENILRQHTLPERLNRVMDWINGVT